MKLLIDVSGYYDWSLKHQSEVPEGAVALPSYHGEQFRLVQELVEEPNYVEVYIPDGDVDRMVEDHQRAVWTAREGYTATHEGGSAHGQEVTVPPRNLPLKSRNRLIADHLSQTVLPQHCGSSQITKVKIVDAYRNADGDAEDPKKLQRFLNAQLVEDAPEEELEEAPAVEQTQAEDAEEDQ